MRLPEKNNINRYFRLCTASFFCLAVFLAYQYLVYATKPSPLHYLGGNEAGLLAMQLVFIASIIAVSYSALILLIENSLGRLGMWLTTAISVFCIAVAIAIAIENFMYTVFATGMKSTNFIILKAFVVYLSIRIAMDISRKNPVGAKGGRLRWGVLVMLTALLGIVSLVVDHARQSPDRLGAIKALHKPNIIILSADGVDAEHMGVYGYARNTTPFLSSRANEFALYVNAFTNNAHTTGSIASMLTGMSPRTSGVVYPPDMLRGHASTHGLPQLLGDIGYRRINRSVSYYSDAQSQNMVGAFDSDNDSEVFAFITMLLPDSHEISRWFVSDIAGEVLDVVHGGFLFQDMDNPFNVVASNDSFVQDSRNLQGALRDIDGVQPFFVNTHFMMTHGAIFPVRNRIFSRDKLQASEWMPDFYDDAIRDFDDVIKTVYERLERSGRLDNTIIVITSDHGSQWSKLKRIPLMIRFPDMKYAGAYSRNVQRLDIAPTIASYIGIDPPSWMDGDSLLTIQNHPANRSIMAYGVLNEVNISHNQHGHIGDVKAFNNHSVTLVNCSSAYTLDSGALSSGNAGNSLESLRKGVSITRPRSDKACAEKDEMGIDDAILEILRTLNIKAS